MSWWLWLIIAWLWGITLVVGFFAFFSHPRTWIDRRIEDNEEMRAGAAWREKRDAGKLSFWERFFVFAVLLAAPLARRIHSGARLQQHRNVPWLSAGGCRVPARASNHAHAGARCRRNRSHCEAADRAYSSNRRCRSTVRAQPARRGSIARAAAGSASTTFRSASLAVDRSPPVYRASSQASSAS
jgi:hypothetical protein